MSIRQLLSERSLVVCVGPGGVGKTTIAASMGLEAARLGRNTLVLTIDPAKRLADALGLSGLDDAVQEVDTSALTERGVAVDGKLYAAMLDTGASFDALMRRVAPTPEARERILNNRVYRAMAGTLARSHAYVAMERLYEVMNSGDYDLVILDTPPTRNALDILDAPGRLVAFLEENVVRWFIGAGEKKGLRGRLRATGSAAATKLLGMLAGQEFLDEIIAFFESFYDLREGFRERADAARAMLRRKESAFVVVSSGDAANIEDAWALAEGILGRGVRIEAAVFNRSYEPLQADPLSIVTRVESRATQAVQEAVWPDAPQTAVELIDGVGRVRAQAAAANSRTLDAIERLMDKLPDSCRRIQVARLEGDISDLAGLAEISPYLQLER